MTNNKQQQMTNNDKWQTTTNDKQQQMTNSDKWHTTTNDKQRQMTNNDKWQTMIENNKQQKPIFLMHIMKADHSDNPDWSMINQKVIALFTWSCALYE